MQSHSVKVGPTDSRCRYWAKIIRSGQSLPIPSSVVGANDIPYPYLRNGDEELLPGDVLLEAEANHHRLNRGWTFWITCITNDGKKLNFQSGFSGQKAELKAQGMAPELLTGAGDIAAMIRIAHGVRAGLKVTPAQ